MKPTILINSSVGSMFTIAVKVSVCLHYCFGGIEMLRYCTGSIIYAIFMYLYC